MGMTRAAEFCYIAERQDGQYLMGLMRDGSTLWANDPDLAIRTTAEGRAKIAQASPHPIGFRKVLAG